MRRALLLLLSLGLVALGVVVAPDQAFACSCRGISTTRAFQQADAAFTGTVRALTEVGSGGDRRVDIRIEVSGVYKGEVYATQVVASPVDSAACGLTPEVGSTWTIFATQQVIGSGDRAITRLRTDLCAGNLPAATPPADLGRPAAPRAGESDRSERSVTVDAQLSRGLVTAGLVVLGLALVLGASLIIIWRPRRR